MGIGGMVSWGCAGALAKDFKSGSLVVPECVIDANNQKHRADSGWVHRLTDKLNGVVMAQPGLIAESATILTSPAEKSALRQSCGAVAVDMESAAVARVAADAGLPFIAVRAVADTADSSLPALVGNATDDRGEVRLPALLGQLCLHPGQLPALLRLKKDFDAAMATLRAVVGVAGADLQFSKAPTRG